jgi:hypothetical protein
VSAESRLDAIGGLKSTYPSNTCQHVGAGEYQIPTLEMEKCLTDERIDNGTTRATASLPGLEIEIVHSKSQDEDAEAISINLQAVPSFEAFDS